MAERVDHTARKRDIALKATRLFSQVGYANVSLIQIAETSGVARTQLYRYFKDKREVLDAAIRANTEGLFAECMGLSSDESEPMSERLKAICGRVTEALFAYRDFLTAVYDFVLTMVRQGEDMSGRIVEFTSGTRALLRLLIAQGVADGSLGGAIEVETAADTIFGLFELCASRITLGVETEASQATRRLFNYIDFLAGAR